MAFAKTHDLNIGKYDFSFDIKNEILSACIGYGSREGQRKLITGFCDKKGNGYAILLRLVAMIFDDIKLTIKGDRIYSNYSKEVEKLIESFSQTELDVIIRELREVYYYTQNKLQTTGISHVRLRREIGPKELPRRKINVESFSPCFIEGLRYSELFMLYKAAASLLGKEKIPVLMDALNSFTDTNDKGGYGSISIELSIPIEDILYSYLFLSSKQMEGEEWVIINRCSTGIVEIPVSSIVIANDDIRNFYEQSYGDLTFHSAQQLFNIEYSKTWGNLPLFTIR
ncbi:hypothetical protein WH816_04090 [Klebsiella variicola]|uniref:hypothetical protein n=1 Tax=Klebsiella variicola TaxID=244366 RepID=UPI00339D27B9